MPVDFASCLEYAVDVHVRLPPPSVDVHVRLPPLEDSAPNATQPRKEMRRDGNRATGRGGVDFRVAMMLSPQTRLSYFCHRSESKAPSKRIAGADGPAALARSKSRLQPTMQSSCSLPALISAAQKPIASPALDWQPSFENKLYEEGVIREVDEAANEAATSSLAVMTTASQSGTSRRLSLPPLALIRCRLHRLCGDHCQAKLHARHRSRGVSILVA